MGTLTKDQVNNLPTSFKTVPYSSFFKLWYALQKSQFLFSLLNNSCRVSDCFLKLKISPKNFLAV